MFIKCWHIDGAVIRPYISQINETGNYPGTFHYSKNHDVNMTYKVMTLLGMAFLESSGIIPFYH